MLRERCSIEAHLYIDENVDFQQKPESDIPELDGAYPDWIHSGPWFSSRAYYAPWKSPLVGELSHYDANVVSGFGPAMAQFAGRPYFFLPTGGDLTIIPFISDSLCFYGGLRLSRTVFSLWQARGIKKASQIWSIPVPPFSSALRRLNVPKEKITDTFFPLAIDSEEFGDTSGKVIRSGMPQEIAAKYNFTVFHPSRLMIRDHSWLKRSGQWKANDILIRGFANFLARTRAKDAVLVLIDRRFSPDVKAARRLIQEIGIETNVAWIRAARPEGFLRNEMIDLYTAADVVADDFGVGWGWIGAVVMEALALSRPLIAYVDEATMPSSYSWHPILSAKTSEEVAGHLYQLWADAEYRKMIGTRGRQWIEQYHSYSAVTDVYMNHFARLRSDIQAT
jgi:glycosyltransferase involved in cell wall biosynthesis